MGLIQAGFEVVGVDIRAVAGRYYPGEFVLSDALEFLAGVQPGEFDLIWASPPCQRFSCATRVQGDNGDHPDLIEPTRAALMGLGTPWIIENVPFAPLRPDLLLCGQMFGLPLIRHRIFEIGGFATYQPEHPPHRGRTYTVAGRPGGTSRRDGARGRGSTEDWKRAMGIDWLSSRMLVEAIPPAYSRFIAEHVGPKRTFATVGSSSPACPTSPTFLTSLAAPISGA